MMVPVVLQTNGKGVGKHMVQSATTVPAAAAADTDVIGRRVVATIIDALVIGVLVTIVGAVLGLLLGTRQGAMSFELQGFAAFFSFVVILALVFGYYAFLEGSRGQTVGKMLCGIKVVREDTGEVPGFGKASVRTLARIIDGLFSYLVAFVAAMMSEKHQRLGDMAAHTLVVRK
jgi:uncharacterized RDD family membrane protein YckC